MTSRIEKLRVLGYDTKHCLLCGENGFLTKLTVHHIDGNRSNQDPNNLAVICKKCHGKINRYNYRRMTENTELRQKIVDHFNDLLQTRKFVEARVKKK